jgi:hypothetical protein
MSCVIVASLINSGLPATAGGYGGGGVCCRIAPKEAQSFLSLADAYQDGGFRVKHSDRAGATAKTSSGQDYAYGFGSSETNIQSDVGVRSWKRSIQRGEAHVSTGSASAAGFSATFLKARTSDGRYYMYKGMVSAGASAGPGGTSTSGTALGKSVGGRF